MPRKGASHRRREQRKAAAAAVRPIPTPIRRPVAVMDGRDEANSAAMKGLLGRQLASITDTLARASQRRDAELLRRSASKPPAVPTAPLPQAPSPINPYLTSDTEDNRSTSSGGGSIAFGGQQTELVGRKFGQFDFDLLQANSIMGWSHAMPPRVHEPSTNELTDKKSPPGFLHGAYATDVEDPAELLAHLDPTHRAARVCADGGSTEMFAHFGGSEAVAGGPDAEEDPEAMLSSMAQAISPLSTHSEEKGDIDPAQLLAEFDSTTSTGTNTVRGDTDDFDPESLLADLERSLATKEEEQAEVPLSILARRTIISGTHSLAIDTEWEARFYKLLEESSTSLAQTVQPAESEHSDDSPRNMFAEIERERLHVGPDEADGENLEELRSRLIGMVSPSPDQMMSASTTTSAQISTITEDATRKEGMATDITPYIVALQFELAGLEWDKTRGWTTYLFSNGLDGHKACQEKEAIVQQATKELEMVIQQAMEEEMRYMSMDNKTRLSRRLVVSNIAAGAGEEDLREFFYGHKSAV